MSVWLSIAVEWHMEVTMTVRKNIIPRKIKTRKNSRTNTLRLATRSH